MMDNEQINDNNMTDPNPSSKTAESNDAMCDQSDNLSFVMTPVQSEHSDDFEQINLPPQRENFSDGGEPMDYEPSEDGVFEQISQFSTSSVENDDSVNTEDDYSCPQQSATVSSDVCSEASNSGLSAGQPSTQSSKGTSDDMTMGFVVSKKTFDFKPIYEDSKYWRMDETTFTIQSIMKGSKNKSGVKKKVQF